MDEDARAPREAPQELPDSLAWVVPARERRPARVLLVLAAVSAAAWFALAAFGNPLLALAVSLAVFGSVAEGLFPIHCRITPGGVTSRCAWQVRTMPWESVRSVRRGTEGVHLSPFTRDTRLGRARGVRLCFAGGNDSAVLGLVRRYWKQDVSARPAASSPTEGAA